MYLEHFGLREFPFSITPDTAFAFRSRAQQQALSALLVAFQLGEGFVKVVGEVGTGKTLLCRRLLGRLKGRAVTAYLPNPSMSPRGLMAALASELRLSVAAHASEYELRTRIERALIGHSIRGVPVVVCLDEAQTMPAASLEQLRLLSNMETEKAKLMQLVLFGQPELENRLAERAVRQLRQRITVSIRLKPMRETEIAAYLRHRLEVAGSTTPELFEPAAVRAVTAASAGVPRLVNIIANKSLMVAYGRGLPRVGIDETWCAVRDTEDHRQGRLFQLPAWAGRGLLTTQDAFGQGLRP